MIALLLFSCFAVYNWSQGTAGPVSCACLGAIRLSPWMAFTLDLAVVSLLIYGQPVPTSALTRAQLATTTGLFCLAGVLAPSVGHLTTRDGLLDLFPKVLDLGTVPQGTSGQAEFLLRNTSSKSVVITQLETSCPCLAIRLPTMAIPPGAELRAEACLDMSRQPHFAGHLAIAFRATTPEETPAFGLLVLADVRDAIASPSR
jgi:hypothetical protein